MTINEGHGAAAPTTVEAVLGGPFPALRADSAEWERLLSELIEAAITRHPTRRAAEIRGYLVAGDITAIRRDLGQRWQPSVVQTCAKLLRAIFATRELPVIALPPSPSLPMTMSRPDKTEAAPGRKTYYSLTMWIRGDWMLEVHYGSFQSPDDADDFSAGDLALGMNQCLWLHHPYGTSLIPYEDIKIYRRVDETNLRDTPYGIADLASFIDVSTMRCIAQDHGVHQRAQEGGNVVEIDFTEHALELGEAMSANDPLLADADAG